jgi:hypothetical protein
MKRVGNSLFCQKGEWVMNKISLDLIFVSHSAFELLSHNHEADGNESPLIQLIALSREHGRQRVDALK